MLAAFVRVDRPVEGDIGGIVACDDRAARLGRDDRFERGKLLLLEASPSVVERLDLARIESVRGVAESPASFSSSSRILMGSGLSAHAFSHCAYQFFSQACRSSCSSKPAESTRPSETEAFSSACRALLIPEMTVDTSGRDRQKRRASSGRLRASSPSNASKAAALRAASAFLSPRKYLSRQSPAGKTVSGPMAPVRATSSKGTRTRTPRGFSRAMSKSPRSGDRSKML